MKHFFKLNGIVFVILFSILSCRFSDNIVEYENETYITVNKFYASRTILPSYSANDMSNFVLIGNKDGESKVLGKFSDKEGLYSAKIVIDEGIWSFTLTAKKGGSIFSDSVYSVAIKKGRNPLSFNLSLIEENISSQDGNGSFSIKLNFPTESEIKLVKAGLFDYETDEEIISYSQETVSIVENAVNYEKQNVPAGIYRLKAFFYGDENGTILLNTYKELLVVSSDLASNEERFIESINQLYSINYDTNGGVFSDGIASQSSFSRHSEFLLPTADSIRRTGYEFEGWFLDQNSYQKEIIKVTKNTTEDIIVYAKWNPVSYNIQYELNNGENSVSNKSTYTVENSFELVSPTRVGYDFAGWYQKSDFSGDKITKIDSSFSSDLKLFAKWIETTYKAENLANLDLTQIPFNYTIKVTGDITGDTILLLADKIENAVSDITLDLSEATGITDLERYGNIEYYYSDFFYCDSLKSIILPKCLEKIGDFVFKCCGVYEVVIPDKVITIGKCVFLGCWNLKNITIPESVTTIEDSTFNGCTKLEQVNIPNSVTRIGDYAFTGCDKLEEISIPASVMRIGCLALYGGKNLKKILFNDTSTWYHTENSSYKNGSEISVASPEDNVTYFKSTYASEYWYKK